MRFSANLGFLWSDLSLPDAIRAAKVAGFDAVECHWPYETPADAIKSALTETGLDMLGLNTRRGNVGAGDNGLSALPDRTSEARAAISEAITYAQAIGTGNIHVMAGFAHGPEAEATFRYNLRFACAEAAPHGITILIEPLNPHDAPGYFLSTTDHARQIIEDLAQPNLKLMFDCYHVARTEGDVLHRATQLLPLIGHIQFAGVPSRGAPDQSEINYPWLLSQFETLGWDQPFGAEYKPAGDTNASLSWLARART